MARLEISLLGSFRAVIDGKTVTAFESDKARALLAYLAVEADRSHRRETLAGWFWPDHPASNARKNLRQTIYRIRKVLADREISPPHIILTPHEIQFNKESDFWLDAYAFSTWISDCRSHHPEDTSLCKACLKKLQTAVNLFRGDFLSRFSTFNSPEFEWWLLAKRETFRRMNLGSLSQLGTYHELRHDYTSAIDCMQRAIELEPWRETAHRQLMRLLAISGQRGAALRQFQVCQRILDSELGVEPSRETMLCHEQIREGDLTPEN